MGKPSLVFKGLHKGSVFQLPDHFRSDSASDINSSNRHDLEGEISSSRTVDGGKEIQGLAAQRILLETSHLGNHFGRVFSLHLFGEPRLFASKPFHVFQELINMKEALP